MNQSELLLVGELHAKPHTSMGGFRTQHLPPPPAITRQLIVAPNNPSTSPTMPVSSWLLI